MTARRTHLARLALALAAAFPSAAAAQRLADLAPGAAPTPPGRPDFGTASQAIVTLGAFEFSSVATNFTWSFVDGKHLRFLTNLGLLETTVHLPSGALLEKFELEACDTTSAGQVVAVLRSQAVPAGAPATLGLIETGAPDTPGCAVFPQVLASPITIDNGNFLYAVQLQNDTFDEKTLIAAVRLYYRLQVAPAPATATFADVPTTHFYFRAVEALAASGVTGGRGGGNFCPGQSVTRGEMAAFLARALGLHWGP